MNFRVEFISLIVIGLLDKSLDINEGNLVGSADIHEDEFLCLSGLKNIFFNIIVDNRDSLLEDEIQVILGGIERVVRV